MMGFSESIQESYRAGRGVQALRTGLHERIAGLFAILYVSELFGSMHGSWKSSLGVRRAKVGLTNKYVHGVLKNHLKVSCVCTDAVADAQGGVVRRGKHKTEVIEHDVIIDKDSLVPCPPRIMRMISWLP